MRDDVLLEYILSCVWQDDWNAEAGGREEQLFVPGQLAHQTNPLVRRLDICKNNHDR